MASLEREEHSPTPREKKKPRWTIKDRDVEHIEDDGSIIPQEGYLDVYDMYVNEDVDDDDSIIPEDGYEKYGKEEDVNVKKETVDDEDDDDDEEDDDDDYSIFPEEDYDDVYKKRLDEYGYGKGDDSILPEEGYLDGYEKCGMEDVMKETVDNDDDDDDDDDYIIPECYLYDGYESDTVDEDGRGMTKEERQLYTKQVYQSDGFDVDTLEGIFMFCKIEPIREAADVQVNHKLVKYAKKALMDFNRKNATNWEFSKIIKANGQAARGIRYYITFEVKKNAAASDDELTTQILQAQVLSFINGPQVEFCRLKPLKKKKLKDGFGRGKDMVVSAIAVGS